MRKTIILLLSVPFVMLAPIFLIYCGGGSSSGGASTGSVVLYITDSPEDDYNRVEFTINSVQLLHTGTSTTCDVLTPPEPIDDIDITDLSSILQLLDISNCTSRSYNRIHVEFGKQVVLTDMSDTTDTCDFTSYKDINNNPNVLQCNGNSCFIDINGAVNVFSKQNNKLALEFNLKEFEVVDFGLPSCSVTIKVSPLNASGIDNKHNDGYEEGISGYISNLDTSTKSFTMTTNSGTFTVSYTNVTTQQSIDDLLNLANTDQLKVVVEASSINLDTHNVEASSIYVMLEGTVSLLNTGTKTFTLTYQTSKTITVDYKNAEVEGILVDNANVEVKLNGYDGSNYLSNEVEIED